MGKSAEDFKKIFLSLSELTLFDWIQVKYFMDVKFMKMISDTRYIVDSDNEFDYVSNIVSRTHNRREVARLERIKKDKEEKGV